MRKTKKILSAIVAMMMLLSMMVPMTSAAEFSDVATAHKYYKAISNLSAYGILDGFEDGTFRPEDTVTRAQFAKIICYALNVGTVTSGAIDTGFTDVDPNHWAAGNIKMAASRGIINGMGDGTFRPENPVLFEQAVKMVVCALGYGQRAENEGGYPIGHMSVAANIGILKGIAAEDNKQNINANRGTIAKLVDSMLGTEQITSTGEKGETIKDQTLKTVSEDGQVVSVYGATIFAGQTSPCSRNQIEILSSNGQTYTYSISELANVKANIMDYLGKRVTVYYAADDELRAPVLTKLALEAGMNDITVVDLADIQDYSDTEVEYIENKNTGDTDEISVLSRANILYNGVATSDSLSSCIDTSAPGQITFIDSDTDGDADVVFVKVYKTLVVKSKATTKLYDEASSVNDVVIDEEDSSKNITIKKNGSASDFAAIKVGDVVSYASSTGDKVIDVLVSNTVVSGTISQANATQGTINIKTSSGEKTYKKSTYFNTYHTTALEVGTTGKFYLDAFGRIAKADVSSQSAYTYAYLTGFENMGGSTTPSYAIQVIKINGASSASKVTYSLANKFRIDGELYEDETSEIEDVLRTAAEDFAALGFDSFTPDGEFDQVIKFTVNSSGKIDKIVTVDYDADEDNKLIVDKMTSVKCTTAGSRLDKKYIITKAKVLILTEESNGDDKFAGRTQSYFKVNDVAYNLQFVDMTDSFNVPIILAYGAASTGAGDWEGKAPVVITDKGIKTPEGKEEAATYIDVITHAGEKATYFESAEAQKDLDSVEVGDVIRVMLDGEGFVDDFKEVTTLDDMTSDLQDAGANTNQNDAEYRQIFGTANIVGDDSILVAKAFVDENGDLDMGDEESFNINSSTTVIVIDSAKIDAENSNAITVETVGEIIGFDDQPENASKILVYTANSIMARTIVIFK